MFLVKCVLLFAIFHFGRSMDCQELSEKSTSLMSLATFITHSAECRTFCIVEFWNGLKHIIKCVIKNCCKAVSNFYLFTSHFKTTPINLLGDHLEGFSTSVFNPEKKIVILVHGLGSNYTVHWVNRSREAFIEFHNDYVIAFDWRTDFDRLMAATQFGLVLMAELFGQEIRHFVRRLIDEGWKSSDIYMVGHSTGAHIVSFAAKYLREKDGVRLDRITGLDPLGLVFNKKTASSRIDQTDAKFVDCIFTSAPTLALKKPVCTANFYPNYYGKTQPGSEGRYFKAPLHSSRRAPDLYAESILPGHKFHAQKCVVLPQEHTPPINCESVNESTALMGYPASSKLKGIFYVKTNGQYPFALDIHETNEERQNVPNGNNYEGTSMKSEILN